MKKALIGRTSNIHSPRRKYCSCVSVGLLLLKLFHRKDIRGQVTHIKIVLNLHFREADILSRFSIKVQKS